METLASKLRESSRAAGKQKDTFVARTTGAGRALVKETRGAGEALVDFVRSETKGWRRFLVQRVTTVRESVAAALSPRGFERRVLTGIDGTLRAIDARVRGRIAALESSAPKKKPRLNGAARKARPAKRAKSPAPAAAIAGVPRH